MKIIRCYIENFGKLHQFEYHFTEGVNIINQPNGWGKSTFAVFIKAMFYGLEYTTKRSVNENERKKYMPWQGGNFGGNLDFELDGKIYRIERSFGDKDKDDIFLLYDQNTGLESFDYTENIGEEIFKIDRKAYERSTYIPQKDLNISINDSLNAKLSNLIENTNDINNYNTAVSRLENKAKYYKKTGDRGKISELKAELAGTVRLLDESAKAMGAVQIWRDKLTQKNERKLILEKEQEELHVKVKHAAEYEGRIAKRQHYTELCANLETSEKLLNEKKKFFNGSIPTEEELKKHSKVEEIHFLNEKISEEQGKISVLQNMPQEKSSPIRVIALIGAAITLIAGIVAINQVFPAGLVLFAATAVLLCLAIFSKKQKQETGLDEATNNLNQLIVKKESLEKDLYSFINHFSVSSKDYKSALAEIRENLWELNKLQKDFMRYNELKKSFEANNDMSSIQISESSELSLKQLQNKGILIQKELADLNDEITGIKNNIDALSKKADICSELESEKERLEEELNIDLKKHDLLEKTIKYLGNAKEQFSTRYLVDMNNGFNKYINLIDSGLLEAASMDVKLNVKIEEYGSKREIDYFSEGYKDVIGICSRLALVDALFKNESPFIILDDPFANLDEEKLANALSLIGQISSKYQIIYLICHESRIHPMYSRDILKESSQFFL